MKQGAKKNLAGQRKEERDVWSHGNEIHTLPAGSLLPLPGETGLKESAETEKELARKSPDRNAEQRCLLWILALLRALPIL
ncbi:uncharacterized protein RBU33_001093 isoform 2-T7 [Hipposideros larvatus]